MAEGTAEVKTLDYKKASKNLTPAVDKEGNFVVTVPLPGKNKYLVVTLSKESADKKLESLHKFDLGTDLKTKAFIKWINDNKDLAVNKYLETRETDFEFKISVKGAVPVKEGAVEKPATPKKVIMPSGIKEKKIKGSEKSIVAEKETPKTIKAVNVNVVTAEAAKEDAKSHIVKALVDFSNVGGGKMRININISEKELLAGDAAFKKTVEMIVDTAMKEAKKKGFQTTYKIDKFTSINVKTEIQKKIGPALSDKRTEVKKSQKKKISL